MFDDRGFFKRAQLVPSDLALAGMARFRDLDRLTIFADNLVPHVLRVDGVLVYDPRLAARIDAGRAPAPRARRSARSAPAPCTPASWSPRVSAYRRADGRPLALGARRGAALQGDPAPPLPDRLLLMRRARLRRTALDEVAVDPWRAALALAGDERPFALTARWAGGGAILGSAPVRVAAADADPFALLADQPAVERGEAPGRRRRRRLGGPAGLRPGAAPGAPCPRRRPRPVALPDAALAFYDHVLRLDPDGRWWFEALWTAARDAALAARWRRCAGAWPRRPPPRRPPPAGPFALRSPGAAGHRAAVAACRERIAAGELFQANLCLRLDAAWQGAPAALFARAAGACARTAPRS